MKHHVDAMCEELGIALDEIVVSGGGADSPLFMQIFADVFGIPASRSVGDGGASLGAAICAAAATGVYPDVETAAERMTRRPRVVRPDAGERRRLPAAWTRPSTTTSAAAPTRSSSAPYPIFH